MNDKQIRLMLSEIVQEIDYDIWKELFPNDSNEEEIDEVQLDPLFEIAKRHLKLIIDRCEEVHDKVNKIRLRENTRRNNSLW